MSESRKRKNENESFSNDHEDSSIVDDDKNNNNNECQYDNSVVARTNQRKYMNDSKDDEVEEKEEEDDDDDDEEEDDDSDEDDDTVTENDSDIDEEDDDDDKEDGNEYESLIRAVSGWTKSSDTMFQLIEDYMIIVQQQQQQQLKQENINEGGEYILHIACDKCRHDIVLIKLIELFPNSVQVPDDNGDYPLHIACRRRSLHDDKSVDVIIMKLIDIYPMAVQILNIDRYPLHIALCHNQSEDIVLKLLDIYPEAVYHQVLTCLYRSNDINDCYALHMACREMQSLSVIQKLIEMNRMVLYEKDSIGNYPIHCAIYGGQYIDVIKILCNEDPLALQRINGNGESSFHIAYRTSHVTFLEDIIQYSDNVVNVIDHNGLSLLHYTPMSLKDFDQSSIDIILDTLLQCPYINVNIKDNDGNTPLHIACMSQKVCFIQKLLEHQSIRIDEINNENEIPLYTINQEMKQIQRQQSTFFDFCNDPNSSYNRLFKRQVSNCMDIKKLLDDFPVKQRHNAYLYHYSTIVDDP